MDLLFKDLLRELNAEQAEYLIIGGYALIIHSQPRYTGDIDIWIGDDATNAERVYRALARFGAPVSGLTSDDLIDPKSHFQVGISPYRIDILSNIDAVAFKDAWPKRLPWKVDGELDTFYISADDFVANKKAVGRYKDLADAEAVMDARAARENPK
ncbi:MAG: hypothetical protein JSS87_09535 [Acidobacteria bacterium]|nr:hypothetical protein [Acidobacteriota bacterium]